MRGLLLLLVVCQWAAAQVYKEEALDFADAEEDPVTGQLCVTRKYCLANTDQLAKRLPAQPCEPTPPQECPLSTTHPPLTFVVDTTGSVEPDKNSIMDLARKVAVRINETNANIPSYLLVTFNDRGPDYRKNHKILSETKDVNEFTDAVFSLKFDGGKDSKERQMQGLLAAINKSPEKSLICVFTDSGSKDLELGRDIIQQKKAKQLTVYIVLTQVFAGTEDDQSFGTYKAIADEVFHITDVNADTFLSKVVAFEKHCV